MSSVSLVIYPNFPVTNRLIWRSHHASIHSNLFSVKRNCENKTKVTSRSASFIPRRLINLHVISCSRPNRTPNCATIATSDLEKRQNGGFWFRKWDSIDVTNVFSLTLLHVLAASAPFVFSWGAVSVAVVLYFFCGLGVTLCYHRLLTHRSFKIPKWLEYFFAYCGVHAGQRDPIFWVSTHKYHHKYADTDRDPHTPKQGFWFSHIGWLLYNDYIATKCGESRCGDYSNVPELKAQWFYRFLHKTYIWHPYALATLLYFYGGFSYVAWGSAMRIVLENHFTFLVTSACHIWGERPWDTQDTSTNNGLVAMFTFGEGWHNNHHAFPNSARHGLEWWQFDITWEVIRFLEKVGLATDVKLPTDGDIKRMKMHVTSSKQTK